MMRIRCNRLGTGLLQNKTPPSNFYMVKVKLTGYTNITVYTSRWGLPKVCINLERWMCCEEITVKSSFKVPLVIRVHQDNQVFYHAICMLTVVKMCPQGSFPSCRPPWTFISCNKCKNENYCWIISSIKAENIQPYVIHTRLNMNMVIPNPIMSYNRWGTIVIVFYIT